MIRNNGLGRFKAGGNRVKMYLSRLKANPGDQGDLGSKIGHGRKLFRRAFPEGASTRSILAPGSVSQPSTAPYCIYQVADYFQIVPLYPTTKSPAAKVVSSLPFYLLLLAQAHRQEETAGRTGGRPYGRKAHRHTQEHRQQERQTEKGPHTIDQTRQEHPDQPWTKTLGTNPAPPPN